MHGGETHMQIHTYYDSVNEMGLCPYFVERRIYLIKLITIYQSDVYRANSRKVVFVKRKLLLIFPHLHITAHFVTSPFGVITFSQLT